VEGAKEEEEEAEEEEERARPRWTAANDFRLYPG
jgi:hypothetical protein